MHVYKLTDQYHTTMKNTQWGPNITHHDTGNISGLGTKGWLHFYHHPIIATLLNPVHANIKNPTLWKAKAEGKILLDQDIKGGCTKLTTIRRIPLPIITDKQLIEFTATLALQAETHPTNKAWLQHILDTKPTRKPEFASLKSPSYITPFIVYLRELIERPFPYFDFHKANAHTIDSSARHLHNTRQTNTLTTITHNFFQGQNP